jgi:hypothetical protein
MVHPDEPSSPEEHLSPNTQLQEQSPNVKKKSTEK